MGTPAGAIKVGATMYLFKAETDKANCVIDAHGGFLFECREFKVPPGVKVKFYCDHGSSLADTGQEALKLANNHVGYAAVETLDAGDRCPNYLLSKAWGTHTFDDTQPDKQITYKTAKDFLTRNDDRRKQKLATQKLKLMKAGKEAQVDYDSLTDTVSTASLLAIRNRWDLYAGVTLEDAIKGARRAMPSLATFHCCFCRTPALFGLIGGLLGQTPEGPMQTAKLA
jgi:hypothetical protein